MKRNLGPMESQLLAYGQMRQLRTLRRGDAARALRISPKQEANLLSRLARAGLIARVWRGLYLLPPRLPLGGTWTPDEGLAITTLMDARKGRYQVCGPNAFNRYGFDEQVPARVYAYNNRVSGDRSVGAVALTLIKVADARLGDTEPVRTADGISVAYSSRVRTLIDAVYDWSRFNGLPRAYDWIRAELTSGRVSAADLVRVAMRYGDIATVRRIGALLERLAAPLGLLRKMERELPRTTGPIPWVPTRPKRGSADRRWGVVWNDRT